MTEHEALLDKMLGVLRERYGTRIDDFLFPPPIFKLMQGELLEIDLENGVLVARFPILDSYLNPYRTMQGGMLATAADNTIGPLSVLVAPPNVTRTLEMKYSQPATPKMDTIIITAKLAKQDKRRLHFEADVHNSDGEKLAKAKAVHWILKE
ncbi:MAG: PaaI family thioesterase [Anaerolineae bacterium]|jgi:acyl-coenzyme A thioesterase PaaI-like protein|nr:PaaI family thioesterase [Anaerolineae bacterium]MBT7189560.1 PaaI family thioesterase [Anaerolineae bacterium]MBT7992103.1 PaaI family thioesterase [Anaerolineae bacterium]